jgi:diguanylate cyclase (GGDEF)-like protein
VIEGRVGEQEQAGARTAPKPPRQRQAVSPSRDREIRRLLESGRIAEANVLFDRALEEPLGGLPAGERVVSLTDHAVMAWRLGRIPLALQLAAEGWTELGEHPAGGDAANALSKVGYLLEGIGNRAAAVEVLRMAVEVARGSGDTETVAVCLQRLGGVLNFRAIDGPPEQAETVFAEARTVLAEGLALAEDERLYLALLGAYGRSLAGTGSLEAAAECARRTRDRGEQREDRWEVAVGSWVLAVVCNQRRELAEARDLMAVAVGEAARNNDTSLRLRFSQDLAEVCAALGDHEGEAAALRQSLAAVHNANETLREGLGQALEQRRVAVRAQQLATAAQEAAARDPLTGLANRLGLERSAPERLSKAAAGGCVSWLVLVDVDWFKDVNDDAGHAAGDAVLREIATLLRRETRTHDLVARWAGDEFVVLLADRPVSAASAPAGPVVAERIRGAVAGHDWTPTLGCALRPTVSIGVAQGPGSMDTLFTAADIALYQAKRGGRDRVRIAADKLWAPAE